MKPLALLLILASSLVAEDRPRFIANVVKADAVPVNPAPALCVTIAGVDWDIEQIDAEYKRAWTWPGMTESSLKAHLREHEVTGFDGLSFGQLQRVHAVIHEREAATVRQSRIVEPATGKQSLQVQPATIRNSRTVQSGCPGGVCPQYQPAMRQGWFGFRRR